MEQLQKEKSLNEGSELTKAVPSVENTATVLKRNFPSRFFSIREELSLPWKIVLGIIPIAIVISVWFILTRINSAGSQIISPLILPSPLEVIKSFHSLWFEAELSRSVIASFYRVLIGFIVSLLIAFPLSLAMGSFTKIRAFFEPSTIFLSYLPIPALVPLTMSLFGIGELQKTMFLGLAFFIYLLPLFLKSFEEVDTVYLQTAYTLGAKRKHILFQVLLPIALPKIIHAMRLGFGVGWTYIILVEMVAADRGLGHIIIVAQRIGPRAHIYLILVVIVIIAYLTDKLWALLYDTLFPYKKIK